ncbi:MAG: AraC family transcriptional regulator [Eubacteriales bacterium]|jgi:AraC family cel operon transcriptional repressor
MSVLQIIESQCIDTVSETRYRVHWNVDSRFYPQVHDFFELMLIISGELELTLGGTKHFCLKENELFLIRPYEVHDKAIPSSCHYINLSFPRRVVDDLFSYLGENETKELVLGAPDLMPVPLTRYDTEILEYKLEALNAIPIDQPNVKRRSLRCLVIDIIANYFICGHPWKSYANDIPTWLIQMTTELKQQANFLKGLDYIYNSYPLSKEHICRSFQRYLKTTPSRYVNDIRLNYAANLLSYSDKSVIDICFDSGFNNISYFNRLFKEKYGCTPRSYRKSQFHR